jgi:hypothetical protein
MFLLRLHSRFAPPSMENLYPVVMLLFLQVSNSLAVGAGNPRRWLGPDNFVDGNFPFARYLLGFTATEDNRTYVFGGSGPGTFQEAVRGWGGERVDHQRCGHIIPGMCPSRLKTLKI